MSPTGVPPVCPSPHNMEGPISFVAPELAEETLMEVILKFYNCKLLKLYLLQDISDFFANVNDVWYDLQKEHNETVAKLTFVLALVECIVELAQSRSSPITESVDQKHGNSFKVNCARIFTQSFLIQFS